MTGRGEKCHCGKWCTGNLKQKHTMRWRRAHGLCRSCGGRTEINKVTNKPYAMCELHRVDHVKSVIRSQRKRQLAAALKLLEDPES